MSNLGDYQKLTTVAKKVGGPKKLALLIFGAGIIAYKGGEVFFKSGVKLIERRLAKKKMEQSVGQYEVKHNGASNENIVFVIGEYFRVLESDSDSVLIEKIGDINNPYFVSAEFLKEISDYKD